MSYYYHYHYADDHHDEDSLKFGASFNVQALGALIYFSQTPLGTSTFQKSLDRLFFMRVLLAPKETQSRIAKLFAFMGLFGHREKKRRLIIIIIMIQ